MKEGPFNDHGTTRRRFLEDALLAAAAAVTLPACRSPHGVDVRSGARPVPRGQRIRIGVVGVRGRGRAHIKAFKDSPDAEVVYLCDPDTAVVGPAAQAVPEARYVRDMRRILDDRSIHAVSFATPNHWHALGTVWALQAGKHVYVEKPLSYDLAEGRAVVAAAEESGLVVQHGTQARSQQATRDALAWMQAGGIGAVRLATGLCYKSRPSIGKVAGVQPLPATLDYDLWCGPAEMRPLRRRELHYDWHWDFHTGNGDIGNQGVHQMDIARWGLGLTGFPRRVVSAGGRLGYDDDGNTPNTLVSAYDYGAKRIVFEVRGLPTPGYRETHIGVVFHGTEGYLVSSSYSRLVAFDLEGRPVRTFTGGGDHHHFQGFLDAVRAARPQDVTAGSRDGHVSSGLCHLGNVSYRLGESRKLAELETPFGADFEAGNEAVARMRAHLEANDLDPARVRVELGPALDFDARSERFVGPRAAEANALCRRDHRPSYAFPVLA